VPKRGVSPSFIFPLFAKKRRIKGVRFDAPYCSRFTINPAGTLG
jgi:hypothetical protein